MKNSIQLNGETFDLKKSEVKCSENLPAWEMDIFQFLVEWFSDNDAISVQTSGSTGTPKIIKKQKHSLINSALMTGQFFSFEKDQSALLCLPSKFIAGKMMLVRAISWELKLDYVEPKINLQIPNKNYQFSAMTPQQVAANISSLSKINNLIIGGAPVSNTLEKDVLQLPVSCFATYGMTETVSHIALREIKLDNNIYHVLPHILINQDARECLVIDAPKLISEPITTNDIVEIVSPNQFIWKGRFDNVINSGGVKISPEIVEEKIKPLLIGNYFIAGIPDEKWGEKVVLIIESDTPSHTKLNEQLATILSKPESPKDIYFIDKFQFTENGKLNRKETVRSWIKSNS